MLAILVKALSRVKRVVPCSKAIAAIKTSLVVTATPFERAARKMLAASRYVENPLGSSKKGLGFRVVRPEGRS